MFGTVTHNLRLVYEMVALVGTQQRKDNFSYCIQPAYIMSRIFGLLPFGICYSSNGEILKAKVGIFNAVWFIGAIALNLILAYVVASAFRLQAAALGLSFSVVGGEVIVMFGFSMAIISIVLDMINRNRLIKIVEEFNQFDNKVGRRKCFSNDNLV